MKKYKVLPVIAAFLSAIAVSLTGEYAEADTLMRTFSKEANGISIEKFIILAALSIFYTKVWDRFKESRKWITHFISVFFAVCMLVGLTYSANGSWIFILGNKNQVIISACALIGYFILFDISLSILYQWMVNRSIYHIKPGKPFPVFIENHFRLFAFLVIYICWLPYLICCFPGSVPWDGYRQLDMFFGGETFTNRHAWVLTMFVGFLMKIGRLVSDNMGVFLIVLVTSLIEAACYSTVCYKIKKWKAPKSFCIGSILFFGILPVFGAYSQTVIKDSIFSGFLALFMVLYIECAIPALQKRSDIQLKKQFIILTIAGILVCFTRNNGIYMVVPAMLLLVFLMSKKQRILILFMSMVILVGYEGTQKVLAPRLGISPISTRAYFSIPFQQTARYLVCYPDDVTEGEKSAINHVLQYDKLAGRYNPELSDPVKATFRTGNVTKKELLNYFKAWGHMFLRHPGVYIEATLHNTYGYYYPFYHCTAQGSYRIYMATGDNYKMNYHYVMPKARNFIVQYVSVWDHIPGLALLCNSGFYTWVLIILAGYLIYRRRWKGILAMALPFLNVAICIASPVNGLLRYVFPLIACMPSILYWCIGYGEKEFTCDLK